MKVSIVIPVYNEEENLEQLNSEITQVIKEMKIASGEYEFEIIYVDDGSTDKSKERIRGIAQREEDVRAIFLRKNFGQTAAIKCGFDNCTGEIIITLDADLQNDPQGIKILLEKMKEGWDVVSGWRQKRHDSLFFRRIPSYFGNRIISLITGTKLKDYGCTLKAYKKESLKGVRLYGEMHRYLPAVIAWQGAKICEIPVKHRKRIHGKSKYGLGRFFKVVLDVIAIKFLGSYITKPLHFFGAVGIFTFLLSIICLAYLLARKIFLGEYLIQSPLLLLSGILFIISIQIILMGLLAELSVRTYHESTNTPIYNVQEKVNFDNAQQNKI